MFFRFVVFTALLAVAFAEKVEPCKAHATRECVAKYIASVAPACHPPTKLPTKDSFSVPDLSFENPYFRATDSRYKSVAEGLGNSKNFSLFYDSEADVTVLSLTLPSVNLTGRATIDYHQDALADVTVDTSYKDLYTNVHMTFQWKGKEIKYGPVKLFTTIESSDVDDDHYFKELIAAAKADYNGIVARIWRAAGENPVVNLREQEGPTGRQIFGAYWFNYLCTFPSAGAAGGHVAGSKLATKEKTEVSVKDLIDSLV